MTAKIGTSTNTNDAADVLTPIIVNSTTATVLLSAQDLPFDQPRIKVEVSHDGDVIMWVRRYPASVDNDKKGTQVLPGERVELEISSSIYVGEISAIMNSGSDANALLTWY